MKLKLLVLLCALLCVSGQVYGQCGQYDWPMVNGSKEQTAWAENETELAPPFESHLYDQVTAETISFCDSLLAYGNGVYVYLFDMRTNTTLWSFQIPDAGGSFGFFPAFANSLVLCGAQGDSGLFALNRETGVEVWSKSIGNLFMRNAVPDGDRVYVVGDSLYCLNLQTGSTIWSYPLSGQRTPAVDDSNVYLLNYTFDKFTGDIKWQGGFNGGKMMAVDSQYLYANDADNTIVALTKSDGQNQWTYQVPVGNFLFLNGGAGAISESYLCAGMQLSANQSALYTLDKATGDYIWHQVFETSWIYQPIIANGIVYIIDGPNYDLYGFDLSTGDVVFFDDTEEYWQQPIIADHALFVALRGGGMKVFTSSTTAVETIDRPETPQTCALKQNYPNPFNPATTIRYSLPGGEGRTEDGGRTTSLHTTLKIYNIVGQGVRTLVDEEQEPGYYTVTWDGKDETGAGLPSGVYFYQLKAGNVIETKQMVFLK